MHGAFGGGPLEKARFHRDLASGLPYRTSGSEDEPLS